MTYLCPKCFGGKVESVMARFRDINGQIHDLYVGTKACSECGGKGIKDEFNWSAPLPDEKRFIKDSP